MFISRTSKEGNMLADYNTVQFQSSISHLSLNEPRSQIKDNLDELITY